MKHLFMNIFSLMALSVAMALFSACHDGDADIEEWVPADYMPDESGRYGVRWNNADPSNLGERCFNAAGKKAKIGVGDIPGFSDFDAVYPWSEIRRCNIVQQGGEETIVFEGEPEFRLDGTNGDVFVRIPKFGYERYVENGYEYRVISREGKPHPAFVEDGKVLDAVYVGAFEGYAKDDGLYSLGNVIPSSNITPQDFLNLAQKRGERYTLYDLRTVDMIFSLFAVEYGCRNSGVALGYGCSQYKQPVEAQYEGHRVFYQREKSDNTNCFVGVHSSHNKITVGTNILICKGEQANILTFAKVTSIVEQKKKNLMFYYFDGPAVNLDTDCFIGSCAQSTNWCETCSAPLAWHTGRADMHDEFTANQRNPMRYRWIENIVGNLWHYLPDVTFQDGQMYACENMREYKMHCVDGAYKPVGPVLPLNDELGMQIDKPGYNYWVTSLSCSGDALSLPFGEAFSSNISSRQAFGAFHYLRPGRMIIANGGGFDHEFRSNILTNRAWIYEGKAWYLYGARLMYKQISVQKQ